MSVLTYGNGTARVFKFRSTGALPLFDEVMQYINQEHQIFGRRWEVVGLGSNEEEFYADLHRLPDPPSFSRG